MTDSLSISKSADAEPPRFKTLFSLADWTWPVAAIACALLAVVLTATVKGTPLSFSVQVDPIAASGVIAIVIIAVIKFKAHRKSKRKLRELAHRHAQFLEFDDQWIRYGWKNVAIFTWSWDAVSNAKFRDDDVLFRIGGHRLKFDTSVLAPEELEALREFMQQRQLL